MNEIDIEQIRPELTWRLRRDVLYPQQEMAEMKMDEDVDGMHFGAFKDDYLVAVISLFVKDDGIQFRKFAVEPSVQNQGIGSSVLKYITDFAINEGAKKLWCNARLTAIPFYLKHGFEKTGKLFSNNGFGYEILQKTFSA